MLIEKKTLPDDPEQLKKLIIGLQNKNNDTELKREALQQQYNDIKLKYDYIEEKYLILKNKFFARSSEKLSKYDKDQMLLFNESEIHCEFSKESEELESQSTLIKSHTRKKRGRKKLPHNLPREIIKYELSQEEKECPCCGKERPEIGTEETEELDIIPAKVKVIKHVRLKHGPCTCDDFFEEEIPEIKTAAMPVRLIPGSIASPGLLAYIATSKFVDSLPFYRQSKMFERIDIEVSRATLCNWMISVSQKCQDLIKLMKREIRSGPLIQMDETTVQVLREKDRAPTTKSYMWVSVGYPDYDKPIIIFDYHTGRSKDIPVQKLNGYKGYLQTDGYAGYNEAGSQSGITQVGCFAHARRYFVEAAKLHKNTNTGSRGVAYIKKIYKIEKELRSEDLSPDNFVEKRREKVLPILKEFHGWLIAKSTAIPPQSKAGKAVQYTLNEWIKLTAYLDHYFLTPDNNRAENAIRPFVVGRKNWLFSTSPKGAHTSAVLYSLVETAKANKIEPYSYLRYLFTKLPQVTSENELCKLLPYNISKDQLKFI